MIPKLNAEARQRVESAISIERSAGNRLLAADLEMLLAVHDTAHDGVDAVVRASKLVLAVGGCNVFVEQICPKCLTTASGESLSAPPETPNDGRASLSGFVGFSSFEQP